MMQPRAGRVIQSPSPIVRHPRAEEAIRRLRGSRTPMAAGTAKAFRSARRVQPFDARSSRNALTVIYFLLADGAHSRWHRVAGDEVWTWVEGDALESCCASTPR